MISEKTHCELTHQHIQDYLDGDCNADINEMIESHVTTCVDCNDLLTEEKELRDLLRGIPVPPPSEGFVDRAFLTLEAQHRIPAEKSIDNKRHGFIWGFASAMAAGFALWMVVSLFPVSELPNAPSGQIQIALHETHKLRLAFHANSDVKNATISISLPENVALDGYPGETSLAWQTDLTKGDNTLTLPIRAEHANDGVLVAKVEHNGQVKTITVNLNVTKPGMSNLVLTPKVNA